MKKTLHLHVGPHLAGGKLLEQNLLSIAQSNQNANWIVLQDARWAELAQFINSGLNQEATSLLESFRDNIVSGSGKHYLASCEDISGQLPSASGRKRTYSKLFENLILVREVLHPIQCKFYFFARDPDSWSYDVYLQHLRSNRKYLSYDRFREANKIDEAWDTVLRKCRNRLTGDFIEIPVSEEDLLEASRTFLKSTAASTSLIEGGPEPAVLPSKREIERLEGYNRAAGSDVAIERLKNKLLHGSVDPSEDSSAEGLKGLGQRARQRVRKQKVSWVLPEVRFPLGELWDSIIQVDDVEFPSVTRVTMEGQARILRFRMRGLPEPCFILGMLISYLRRDTDHTQKALELYNAIWSSEGDRLLAHLPTRWLISSLQTFLDHGTSPEQRIIGSAGYFFANTVRAYEAERALEGLEVDKIYDFAVPKSIKLNGAGLDRFDLGRTDMIVNTLSLLFEVSLMDDVSGRVLREFVLRLRSGHTLFSRMDQSRIAFGLNPKGFADCWSFYEDPRGSTDSVG